MYRSIIKVISLSNISKVFSHFSYTLIAISFPIHGELIVMPFNFYKSADNI